MKNNSEVQALIHEAVNVLKPSNDTVVNLKVDTVKNCLTLFGLYSCSANSIPSLSGLGLDEVIKICELIIALEGDITSVSLNFKALANILIL